MIQNLDHFGIDILTGFPKKTGFLTPNLGEIFKIEPGFLTIDDLLYLPRSVFLKPRLTNTKVFLNLGLKSFVIPAFK